MITRIITQFSEIESFPSSDKVIEVSEVLVTFSNGKEVKLNNENSKLDGDKLIVYLSKEELNNFGLDKYINH